MKTVCNKVHQVATQYEWFPCTAALFRNDKQFKLISKTRLHLFNSVLCIQTVTTRGCTTQKSDNFLTLKTLP